MAHSTWLFLITPSDKIWERTSEPSSVEVILWVWGADLIWPNTCFAYLHYLLQCIQGPQTYQFENNKHLLSHDFCGSEIQEQLSCGWARVAVIWRSPGSGGGRLFLSSLMYMLAGSFSSLLVDLTARFLMTWRDTRGQDRENDQDRSHCVFITWSWRDVPSFLQYSIKHPGTMWEVTVQGCVVVTGGNLGNRLQRGPLAHWFWGKISFNITED